MKTKKKKKSTSSIVEINHQVSEFEKMRRNLEILYKVRLNGIRSKSHVSKRILRMTKI